MKVLVVGSGGREHALAWKLSQEAEVVCAPGNPGIAMDVETRPLDPKDPRAAIDLARQLTADLVVIGPEDPLVAGLADHLREAGFAVFGPSAEWARLEGSKAFSKALMAEAGVPTARFDTFTDPAAAREHARRSYAEARQLAVKASGTALGKGVTVASTLEEAIEAIDRMMAHREFGSAGDTVVLEERLIGREFSLLTLIGDHNYVSLPVAQDHKRAFDGDQGPNTGGMGAYSPCEWITQQMIDQVEATMVEPIFKAIKQRGGTYRGTLFTGVMVTDQGSYCLEYNVRLGDPETQTVMMRLGERFAQSLMQAATGKVIEPLQVLDNAAVTVVVASGGYPGDYRKGLPIEVSTLLAKTMEVQAVHRDLVGRPPDTGQGIKLFWAGASERDGGLVTAGGRVVGVTGFGDSLSSARAFAYGAAAEVRFEGAFFRTDIGPSS